MKLAVRFRPQALAEFEDATDHYEAAKPGLGGEFASAVFSLIDAISSDPQRYPFAERSIREAPVPRFPFVVYYKVGVDRLVILAVFHQSRDPGVWRERR